MLRERRVPTAKLRVPTPFAREMAPSKLLDQVREAARRRYLSSRTERAYVFWFRRFVSFHRTRYPRERGTAETRSFLAHLTVERNVAAPTRYQALLALPFFCRKKLSLPLADPG